MSATIKLGIMALAIAAPVSQAHAERIFGLESEFAGLSIVTFDSAAPGTILTRGVVTGVARGDRLVGLDLRPATRQLYSLGTSGRLYLITKNASGRDFTATSVGTLTTPPGGAKFGTDFNPTVDRLRVVSDTGQNLRINPNNPALAGPPPGTIVDTPLTLNGTPFGLSAVAYRNSRAGATTTVLYGLDPGTDSLVRATNANLGTYTDTNVNGQAFGPLGVSFGATDRVHFDISGGSNQAFFVLNDVFYTVDQLTGAGALVGAVGVVPGQRVPDLAGIAAGAVPEPATWGLMIAGFGLVGVGMRRRSPLRVAS